MRTFVLVVPAFVVSAFYVIIAEFRRNCLTDFSCKHGCEMERKQPYCVDVQLTNRVQEYVTTSGKTSIHLDDVVTYLVQKYQVYKRKPQAPFRKAVASSTY